MVVQWYLVYSDRQRSQRFVPPGRAAAEPELPAPAPAPRDLDGSSYQCLWCGHGEFDQRNAQMNTAVATFFNLDWANRSAKCLICRSCGHVHWFLAH